MLIHPTRHTYFAFPFSCSIGNKLCAGLVLVLLLFCNTFCACGQDISQRQERVQLAGDVIVFALPLATLGSTFILKDKQGSWQFTKGLVAAEAVTFAMKWAIDKPRPDGSNNNSFPSGHSSTNFHSAGFIHKRYGFKYSIPAYLLAGFTAGSRIYAEKHDIADVLAGTAIGLGSSLIFTKRRQDSPVDFSISAYNGEYRFRLVWEL